MSIGRISTFRKTAHNMWALLKTSSCRHHETNSVGQPKMILYSGNSLIPRLSGHIVAYCSFFSGFVCEFVQIFVHLGRYALDQREWKSCHNQPVGSIQDVGCLLKLLKMFICIHISTIFIYYSIYSSIYI